MRLSPEEERFLKQWMFDEVHFHNGPGPAKRLQLEHQVIPADLAVLIAAAFPDPADQALAGMESQPQALLAWPWSEHDLVGRVHQAQAMLDRRKFEAKSLS